MAKVLVIGAGGAALSAAIAAKEAGSEVIVVTKEYPTRSQTCMAQGGINAALSDEDSIESHIQDTLKAAKGVAEESMVRKMCEAAPQTIAWLDGIGVAFSRTANGHIAQRRLGGASFPRACYAQDYTGLKILHTLYDYANKLGITFANERFLLELLVSEGVCKGGVFLDIRTGSVEVIEATSVVLASGGYSKVYDAFSTNSKAATGDGIAVAKEAGCVLRNMEFVQFHPTALKNSAILISESARGAGGKLLNSKGERFVDELRPRDEVSWAIFQEIAKGEDVFLDITHLGEAFINEELPQERKLAKLYEGIDPLKEPIPIKPVAHYTMGGIAVDANMQTNIQNLFAVGECSEAGVHGANRLGGNSLLEIVAFGREAGANAARSRSENVQIDYHDNLVAPLFDYTPKENFYPYKRMLGEMMMQKCGIERNAKDLKELIAFIEELRSDPLRFGIFTKERDYNVELVDFLEFRNSLTVAKAVADAALANTKSIGAHKRSDR